MKLSNRLLKIADFVPKNSIVADIGTDHGYIPAYLIENNISKKVIGTDISKGSLDKIIDYIRELDIEHRVDTRLGDGLEVIRPYEVDTVIIAGMGGLLIRDILKNRRISDTIIDFILQPMVASKELREYLAENNFEIIDEELVKEDNKYYEIIHARKGKMLIEKDIHYEISPFLIKNKHPILSEFLQYKIDSSSKIINEIENIDTEKSRERCEELQEDVRKYREVLKEIEG